jgi:hypothetical protein
LPGVVGGGPAIFKRPLKEIPMKRWILTGIVAVVACAWTLPVSAVETAPATTKKADKDEEHEVKVKLEDCPKAVQETIKKEAGTGTIEEIEKETEGGKVVYSAEVKIDGKEYDIKVGEDGKLISKEAEDDDDDDDKEEKSEKKEMK